MPSAVPYREQMLRVREDAIVQAMNRLLVTKGYDLVTVDEVAADAGLSKASLYKHFTSKEELAAAAMIRVLDRAIAFVESLRQTAANASAVEQLVAVVRWTLEVQLAGEMPTLPSENSRLTTALRANRGYMDRLIDLSDRLGAWISQAQADGGLNPELPAEMILYTMYARACDPVLAMLRASGQHSDRQIVEWLIVSTFDGIALPKRATRQRARSARVGA
jgi:TetR/AcrR family transcriptional regulator, regulator of autoinduction and epiphytic fitness